MERYIYEGSQTEIIEKKSRFIAAIASVRTKEEAAAFIEERRKQYWDASHHCSAFIIGSNPEITRCSDDKEPSGTGGRPMLEVLKKECIKDVVAVVTRYFGGTLLGTGGLARAYARAVKEGLNLCKVIERQEGIQILIQADYGEVGKLQHVLGKRGYLILEAVYRDMVSFQILVPEKEKNKWKEELLNAVNGKIEIGEERQVLYAKADRDILLYDGGEEQWKKYDNS